MLNLDNKYDLIVAGGGLSGVSAAIAAAREGVNVLLIEKNGFLGGMATAGLVNPLMPYCVWKARWEYNWEEKVNQGIFRKILANLVDKDGLHENNQTFNEEILKLTLDHLIKENKVDTLLHSFISDVNRDRKILKSVTVTNKSGQQEIEADYFIDATGDADLIALADCEYKIGREEDGLCQPMTLNFRLADVDTSIFDFEKSKEIINQKYQEFKNEAKISNPREDVLMFRHVVKDVVHFNSTRIVGKSAVDVEDLTAAEIEGREQVYELYQFMKNNIPGFENSKLLMSAPQIGIRESRRIVGEYVITEENLLNTIKFEDSIARGTYPVDIHNPSGTGTVLKDIPYGDYYTIPYRALIPLGADNLIVAGRPISSTHEAHSAYRVMPICASIGEGAGSAASIAFEKGISFKEVSTQDLHNVLDKYEALY